jgi:hypothetical protein
VQAARKRAVKIKATMIFFKNFSERTKFITLKLLSQLNFSV